VSEAAPPDGGGAPLRTRLEGLLSEAHADARERGLGLADRLIDRRPIVLHGAGNLGRKIARELHQLGRSPVAFSDSNRALWGSVAEGVPVYSPDAAVERFGATCAFVVATWSPHAPYLASRRQLTALGADRVLPGTALFWAHPEHFLPFYLFAPPTTVLEHGEHILDAYELMADEESRRHFASQIEWRLTLDYEALTPPAAGLQYFPPDLVKLTDDEVFVDCGAFDGDSIAAFLSSSEGRFRSIRAYEPDPDSCDTLSAYVSTLAPDLRGRIAVLNEAVSDGPGVLHFDAHGAGSSRASIHGDIEVPCIRLDDEIEAATYLKMDIEGAEARALVGAAKLIEKSGPRLAVCLYHSPEDIFAIPLQVAALRDDYALGCRAHLDDGIDLVLYASR
jgi:FkbM family methyltransferase